MAEVVSIHCVRTRNGVAEPLAAAPVRADYGIEGDWRSHAHSGRQLTLIEEDALLAAGCTLGYTVPAGASRRQVVVRGLPLNPTVGKLLRVGELELEVTELCEPCSNMERTIGPGGRAALGDRGGVCTRVLRGGVLRVADPVCVTTPIAAV